MPEEYSRPDAALRVSRRTLLAGGLLLLSTATAGAAVRATTADPASPIASPVASPAASPLASPASRTTIVKMTAQLRFDPPQIEIAVGDAVTWVNVSPLPHTATGDPAQNPVRKTQPELVSLPPGAKPWGSKLLNPGEHYTHVFTVSGTYRYICIPHVLSGMRATIVVKD